MTSRPFRHRGLPATAVRDADTVEAGGAGEFRETRRSEIVYYWRGADSTGRPAEIQLWIPADMTRTFS